METEILEKKRLTQYEYEQIKILNKEAFNVIQDFLCSLDEVLINNVKEIGVVYHIRRIYEFKKVIDAQSRIRFEKIKIIIELGKQEYTEKNGHIGIERYFYDDVYNVITKPVSQQKLILKKYTRKIIKLIQEPKLRKEFQKCRVRIRKELDKLEVEQDSILNINK